MIEAMKEIGEYALEKENKALNDFVSILVENPASNETYKHVFCIKFASSQDHFEFKGIEHQEYSKEKIAKYLYKRGSSNGPDITPTARVTEIKKTFLNKIIGWFSKPLKEAKPILDGEEVQFLELLGKCIKENEEIILSELEPKVNSIDAKENSILTLVLEENGFIRYVGDFEVFRKILKNNGASKFYSKYDIVSKEDDKVCSVCKTHKEVYGFVTPYEFYTVDKRGFVSGGFDQSKAWRNNPVCLECALKITAGKEYIEKYMSFGFYGFNFLLIPKLLTKNANEDIFDVFENFNEKKFAFNEGYQNFLQANEIDILNILSEKDDYLNFNFQFYEKSNSAYRILLYIEDVLPSRLRKLFKSKEIVDKRHIFRNYFSNDTETKSIQFTLGNVRWFFPNTLEDPDLNKYFLEITNGIFTGTSIDYNFLLKYVMQRIRKDFRNENSTRYSLFLGFQMLDFLNQLRLLGNYNGGKCVNSKNLSVLLGDIAPKENSGYEERTNVIFSEFESFFNTDAKKAIFLEGTLVQYLLNIQKYQRGSTPFRTKLRGLNLDERHVKRIFPEIINKLEEYDSNYYKELENLISKYMIQSGTDWKMPNDEISFYFVLGMNMSNLLKSPKSEMEIEND
ncbi:CRISPR-associated protein, Csh1 family [Methanosarcina lacustris Z-7289]|uniref:CRISPR-associated protein, Csh1 family n=1 Tax=Methanosarcina lacustris Z-7289 TaxID=1434111 RepID=A0A0E3S8T1_9EURY|nr:TIGR02556 family CRISPR-associated protein [Methanosarcina lacustris]AKB75548.1 CRISPR-associated protein, Csh1 family [Methanosarcina lacustris Z-7289]